MDEPGKKIPVTKTIIKNTDLNGVPQNIVEDVISFCLANRQADTDWIILPVTNFNYYCNTMFEKKYLSKIPESIIFRDKPKREYQESNY